MTNQTVKVSLSAVHNRIRRILATRHQVIKKNRKTNDPYVGQWFIVEKSKSSNTARIVSDYADLTAAARDLGVLNGYEVIDDE